MRETQVKKGLFIVQKKFAIILNKKDAILHKMETREIDRQSENLSYFSTFLSISFRLPTYSYKVEKELAKKTTIIFFLRNKAVTCFSLVCFQKAKGSFESHVFFTLEFCVRTKPTN